MYWHTEILSMQKEMLFIKLYFAILRKQTARYCFRLSSSDITNWRDNLAVIWFYLHFSVTVLRPVMLA